LSGSRFLRHSALVEQSLTSTSSLRPGDRWQPCRTRRCRSLRSPKITAARGTCSTLMLSRWVARGKGNREKLIHSGSSSLLYSTGDTLDGLVVLARGLFSFSVTRRKDEQAPYVPLSNHLVSALLHPRSSAPNWSPLRRCDGARDKLVAACSSCTRCVDIPGSNDWHNGTRYRHTAQPQGSERLVPALSVIPVPRSSQRWRDGNR